MQITKANLATFEKAVELASEKFYDGNVIVHPDAHETGSRTTARLYVRDSSGKGARKSWSGRRMRAACWHAYRDALIEFFELAPDATVRTGMATYKGRDGFQNNYPGTAYINIGSMMSPAYMPDLCECENNG